jgi:hypothetical protein
MGKPNDARNVLEGALLKAQTQQKSGHEAQLLILLAVDHHLPVCLRRLGARKECRPLLPLAADNLPQAC